MMILFISLNFFLLLIHIQSECPLDGYYHDYKQTQLPQCPGLVKCEPGYYCINQIKLPCPRGYFGDSYGLMDEECSGICPAGFYCKNVATSNPLDCGGPNFFCPEGSINPTRTSNGYYSIGLGPNNQITQKKCEKGSYCINGEKKKCPAGTYGMSIGLSTSQCSGLCPAGFYCPEGSSNPYAHSCDYNPLIFCPIGTVIPQQVHMGSYAVVPLESEFKSSGASFQKICPLGHYCPNDLDSINALGRKVPCPGGTYGNELGLVSSKCSGKCKPGYFCPPGSIKATQNKCESNRYCPLGSASPIFLNVGEYIDTEKTSKQRLICPMGSYCIAGKIYPCPPGTYGNVTGLSNHLCSGPCQQGYFCTLGSKSATERECGNSSFFCPEGSSTPLTVDKGYYTIGQLSLPNHLQNRHDQKIRYNQIICEPGYFCNNGIKTPCEAGRYGSSYGLTSDLCSDICPAGFYCPKASKSGTNNPCGNASVYCPIGSSLPNQVASGYCSFGSTDETTQSDQYKAPLGSYAQFGVCHFCPAGRYGNTTGLATPQCSGRCKPGYYCPTGSVSESQAECGGPNMFCPGGNSKPFLVSPGFYTTIYGSKPCPPGKYRIKSTVIRENYLGVTPISINYGDFLFPLDECGFCPEGTYKLGNGDSINSCIPCPSYTSFSSDDRRNCVCYRLSGGAGSQYNTSTHKLVFDGQQCILEKITFRNTLPLIPNENSTVYTKFHQTQCEPGYFCQYGIRYPCPGGRYGDKYGEINELCAGTCLQGYFCPIASTNANATKCGNSKLFCPEGSAIPSPARIGYYTSRRNIKLQTKEINLIQESFDSIRSYEYICEKGYYCINGKRYKCPIGRYGDKEGEINSLCTGACSRGYFCPEGSTSPFQFECGSTSVVCRTGTTKKYIVPMGYYSKGLTNTTRFFMELCPPGYFCQNGMKYQCPEGYYGSSYGMSISTCSGICKKGYRCPSHPHLPSISNMEKKCGQEYEYCPDGTGNLPKRVKLGYYTIGESENKFDEKICPLGSYCVNGQRKFCPSGVFGSSLGLMSSKCSGICQSGYFCPEGSTSPTEKKCKNGEYSSIGSSFCLSCPTISNQSNYSYENQSCYHSRKCCFTV